LPDNGGGGMTTLHRDLPKPIFLEATLRKITECLAKELACPTQIAPGWSDYEWTVARAVAAIHGISPLLSRTLRWQGPAAWKQFLEEQRSHTQKRHARIDELLRLIDRMAREAGVAAVALKGVELHALGVYQAGDRPMADIDLLVRPQDAQITAKMLESMGYYQSRINWKERAFSPLDHQIPGELGEQCTNDISVELHERICEKLPWHITDITARIYPANAQPGLNGYPSKASLMTHLLLHSTGSMAFKTLRMLQLNDLAQLSSDMTEQDWDEVLQLRRLPVGLWWAFPPLLLAARYFPSRIPMRVLAALAENCSYRLKKVSERRTLYGVSLSYLWVDAFPGVEWAQTFREILGYAASRVWPDGKHVALRAHVAKSQPWSPQSQWPQLSQSRRILRWLTSRPMRPLTAHAVRAALAQV
jgi:Uncharacterised nucleotidyltransferase